MVERLNGQSKFKSYSESDDVMESKSDELDD